jgi:hypothetical protein
VHQNALKQLHTSQSAPVATLVRYYNFLDNNDYTAEHDVVGGVGWGDESMVELGQNNLRSASHV